MKRSKFGFRSATAVLEAEEYVRISGRLRGREPFMNILRQICIFGGFPAYRHSKAIYKLHPQFLRIFPGFSADVQGERKPPVDLDLVCSTMLSKLSQREVFTVLTVLYSIKYTQPPSVWTSSMDVSLGRVT